jgi:hypothetical protein
MTKDPFHAWLREWVKRQIAAVDGDENRIDINQRIESEFGSNGGRNHVLQVELPCGAEYILKGNTTFAAVVDYLDRLRENPDLSWERGEETSSGWRVNPGGEHLADFQFYENRKDSA